MMVFVPDEGSLMSKENSHRTAFILMMLLIFAEYFNVI